MSRTKKFFKEIDFMKAVKRGSREAEIENSTGFKSSKKIHKSVKSYQRKPKHKNSVYDY